MNWYNGNIAEAVAHSKSKNAVFVVYVEGKDENSTKLSKFINEPNVKVKLQSDDFVAIKIESDGEAYMQFASIYQMVPVPSIFFIGKTGTPLEIATGVVASADELDGKISKVLQLAGKSPSVSTASSTSQAFINQESKVVGSSAPAIAPVVLTLAEEKNVAEEIEKKSDESSEKVCEDGVCYKKAKDNTPSTEEEITPKHTDDTTKPSDKTKDEEEKKAEIRKLMEQKRRERLEEEKRLEKERELQRRKEGKDVQNLRDWQKDQEFKELKDSIKRDKLEEQAARERIRAQIAADKAERAHKFAAESSNQASAAAGETSTQANTAATDESRLQFRFASGSNKTNNFKCSTTLGEIRDYVKNELLPGTGIKEFTLATTYPKREYTAEHYSKTLTDLELIPSAVILIIGKEATGPSAIIARQGGLFNIFSMLVMSVLNPIFAVITTAKNWITGQRGGSDKGGNSVQTGPQKRANEDRAGGVQDDVAKRRNLDRFIGGGNTTSDTNNSGNPSGGASGSSSTQAYRRYVSGSNVHRLADNRRDSDDENATWNGNSTQQQ